MKRVFVIGVGRSGTSLLQAMLASHPDIASLPETAFFRRYVARRTLEKIARQNGESAAIDTLAADAPFARLGLDAASLIAEAPTQGLPLDNAVYRAITRHFVASCGVLADKDPRLSEHLPLIKAHFPFSYIVHIIRDPRDVIVSKRNAEWSMSQPLWRQLIAGAAQMELASRCGPQLFGERYITLKYEELIATPQETLQLVCEQIGLRYDHSMLAFSQSAREIVTKGEAGWKGATFGELLSDNSHKWKAALTKRDAALAEKVCKRTMKLGSYEPAASRGGLLALALTMAAHSYSLRRVWQQSRKAQQVATIEGRVAWQDHATLCRSIGNRLYESNDNGTNWAETFRLPIGFVCRLASRSKLLNRLMRGGLHHFVKAPEGTLLVWGRRSYFYDGRQVHDLGHVEGSRPLKLTCAHGSFYYGEYRSNPERDPVHVWRWSPTEGSRTWSPAWQFDDVRHVHGVYHDPLTDALWVTTGDEDHESAIWRTNDQFESLEKVVGGAQAYRAVDLLFTEDYVYFGTDAPGQSNSICRIDRRGTSIKKLQSVSGPVMFGTKVGEALFFSTSVEPVPGKTSKVVEVWGAEDEENWARIATFRKDPWPMRAFQYGQAHFPSGPGDGKRLYVTPFAAGRHGLTRMYILD